MPFLGISSLAATMDSYDEGLFQVYEVKSLPILQLDNKDTLFIQVLLHHFQGYHVEVKDSTAGLGLGIVPRSNQPPSPDVHTGPMFAKV